AGSEWVVPWTVVRRPRSPGAASGPSGKAEGTPVPPLTSTFTDDIFQPDRSIAREFCPRDRFVRPLAPQTVPPREMPGAAMTGEGHRTPIETLSLYPPHGETIGGLLTSRARSAPGRPFLVFRGEVRNYGEVVDLAARAGGLLRARGVTKGDRVAVMASNSDAFVVLFLALASVGAVLVPVNPEFGPAEAAYVFDHAAVSAVACTADTLATARAACAGLARQPWFALLEGTAPDVPIFTDLLSSAPTDAPPDDVTPGDTCLILYTSGTTGFPKGVMHSQQTFVLAGEGFVERMPLQPDDRLFVILPLFHMNALFYSLGGALAAGASLLLVPRFSASEFWRVAAEGGATEVNILAAVGNILTWRPRSEFVAGPHLPKVS